MEFAFIQIKRHGIGRVSLDLQRMGARLCYRFDYFQRSYLVSTTLGFREDMKKALEGLVAAADALGRTTDAEAYRKALADLGTS